MPSRTNQVEQVKESSSRAAVMAAFEDLKQSSEDVQDNIMSAILSATSEEELFAVLEQSTTDARSILDVPLRVHEVKLNESGFKDGPPAYCVLSVTNLRTNKPDLVTCGAGSVLAGMIKLHQLGLLPMDVVLFEGNETANGFKVISFRRAKDVDMAEKF